MFVHVSPGIRMRGTQWAQYAEPSGPKFQFGSVWVSNVAHKWHTLRAYTGCSGGVLGDQHLQLGSVVGWVVFMLRHIKVIWAIGHYLQSPVILLSMIGWSSEWLRCLSHPGPKRALSSLLIWQLTLVQRIGKVYWTCLLCENGTVVFCAVLSLKFLHAGTNGTSNLSQLMSFTLPAAMFV